MSVISNNNTTKLVDVSKLQDATTIYDKALRALPFYTLSEVATALKLNLMDLQGKHTLINERRHAGGTQSYKIGKTFNDLTALLGYDPSDIEPKDVVFIMKANSQKYTDNELLVVGGKPVSNINKRHPLEMRILTALINSHMEDIVFNVFTGNRDEESTTPAGAFDGFATKIADMITATTISAANGNLINTGEFANPANDTDTTAYGALVEFVGSANPILRSSRGGNPQLLVAGSLLKKARAAFRNKLKNFAYPTMAQMLESLREDAMCPGLEILSHEALGNGDQLILTKPGNLDLAFNTQSAAKFCQVRDIYEDPNEWQFWLQAGYDTRIRDWHEKVFAVNDQTNRALDLAGDYISHTVTGE